MVTGAAVTGLITLTWQWFPWRYFTRGWGLGLVGNIVGAGIAWMGGRLIGGGDFWYCVLLWGVILGSLAVCVAVDKLGGRLHFKQIKTLRGASMIKETNGANTGDSRGRAGGAWRD